MRAHYRLASSDTIRTVRERLVVARILMRHAGCYAEEYLATELVVLRDTVRKANGLRVSSDVPIPSRLLFGTSPRGEAQYVNLMWVLEPAYADSRRETIVRRITVWWPMCS